MPRSDEMCNVCQKAYSKMYVCLECGLAFCSGYALLLRDCYSVSADDVRMIVVRKDTCRNTATPIQVTTQAWSTVCASRVPSGATNVRPRCWWAPISNPVAAIALLLLLLCPRHRRCSLYLNRYSPYSRHHVAPALLPDRRRRRQPDTGSMRGSRLAPATVSYREATCGSFWCLIDTVVLLVAMIADLVCELELGPQK